MAVEIAPDATSLALPELSDETLVLYRQAVIEHKRMLLEELSERQRAIEAEIHARIERNGGSALLVPAQDCVVKCALEDQYTAYAYDVPQLREVAKLLPPSEAAKIVKHVAEQVTVVPAHDEPGNPRSITALIKQYGPHSGVGKLLAACMQRSKVGTKLVVTEER